MATSSKSQPSLVIADDEPAILRIIAEVAGDMGFHAYCVQEGSKVIAEVSAVNPAGIVLDLRMPGTDGVEIIRELARQGSLAKIVLMSGMDERTLNSVRALATEKQLDVIGVLNKPMRPGDIEAALAPLLADGTGVAEAAETEAEPAVADPGMLLHYSPYRNLTADVATAPIRLGVSAQWRLDNGEVLSKNAFQQWLEQSGASRGMFHMMVKEALQHCAQARSDGAELELVIRLEPAMLRDLDSADFLSRISEAVGFDNSHVIVEVNEEAVQSNLDTAIDVLSRLRIKGFRTAVTTDSSDESLLLTLEKIPLDEIFVDLYPLVAQGNVKGNMELEFSYSSLTSMLHNKGITTCARNITQAYLLDFAAACGFQWAEGTGVDKSAETVNPD